jgi:hypothetical protein
MASKPGEAAGSAADAGPMSIFKLGKERTDAMLATQNELLETYEQASRAWLARVKSEVDLWSELAKKLTATRSVPEAMQSYQECVSKRMQMAAEDVRRLSEECEKVMHKVTRSMGNGWPTATGT